MDIRRASEDSGQGHTAQFTGQVTRRDLGRIDNPRGTASTVAFEPHARTHWHRHADGQLIVVLEGHGLVAVRDESPVAIDPGDVVVAEPGEEHWHGASEGAMTHVAFSFGDTEWLEPVRD